MFWLAGLAAAGFLFYVVFAYVKKIGPFAPEKGDACLPKSSEKVDKGVLYENDDDGECVVKTCQAGYKKSDRGNRCTDDLDSEYLGVVGAFVGNESAAPVGYETSAIDETHILPFQTGDARENITVENDVLVSGGNADQLSNLCRRTCWKKSDCAGVFLFDDRCMMMSSEFDFDADVQVVEGVKLLKKNK